ncbi:T9SS type A sorting domain-containing protein [Bernardetia sp. Wsw4-3y2]|uniref:Ig-like domain-containing protein n=1 Tax=Bernardetia sp. Wsw4-3y2 TaxID=3127471 RepID=UPI0030D5491A
MTKSYSNLRSLLFVCAVFLLSSFYTTSVFSQCDGYTTNEDFNPNDTGYGNGNDIIHHITNNSYPIIPEHIYATKILPNGKIMIGGSFFSYAMIDRKGLARLTRDGKLDESFQVGSGFEGGFVRDIAVQPSGKILVAGDFTTYNGVAVKPIIRLDINGNIDNTFDSHVSRGRILDIELISGGKIVVAGKFHYDYNGRSRQAFARLNADGTLDSNFDVPAYSALDLEAKKVKKLANGELVISLYINGTSELFVLRNDLTLEEFSPSFYGSIEYIEVDNSGKLLVAASRGGRYASELYKLNQDGTLDSTFRFAEPVDYIALQGDKILVGDRITGVRRLNSDGSLDTTFSFKKDKINTGNYVRYRVTGYEESYADAPYLITTKPDNTFIVTFTNEDTPQAGISGDVRLIMGFKKDGDIDNTFNLGTAADHQIQFVHRYEDGKILIAGKFTRYNGKYVGGIARLLPNGELDDSFFFKDNDIFVRNEYEIPYINKYTDVYMADMHVQKDNKIVLSGRFDFEQNGVIESTLLRLNQDGSIDSSFNVSKSIIISGDDIADFDIQSDGKLIVLSENGRLIRLNQNGSLDSMYRTSSYLSLKHDLLEIDSQDRVYCVSEKRYRAIVRIDTTGRRDNTFISPDYDIITDYSIQQDGKIVVSYKSRATEPYPSLVERLNTDGTVDESFEIKNLNQILPNATPTTTFKPSVTVKNITVQPNGKIVIVGEFYANIMLATGFMLRLNQDGSLDEEFGIENLASSVINDVALIDEGDEMIVVGAFTDFKDVGRNRIASIKRNTPIVPIVKGTSNLIDACPNSTITLQSSGIGTLYWYNDTTANHVAQGNSYITPRLAADTTYLFVKDSITNCSSGSFSKVMITTLKGIRAKGKTLDVYLDESGKAIVYAQQLDGGSVVGCQGSIVSHLYMNGESSKIFSCVDIGTLQSIDFEVKSNTNSSAIATGFVNVRDTIVPRVSVKALLLSFESSNQVTIKVNDFIVSLSDNCTDSAAIQVVFDDTGLKNKVIDCSISSQMQFNLRIRDQAGNQFIQPVTIKSPFAVSLSANRTSICPSEEVLLSATVNTEFLYNWFRNGTAISNESATFVTSEVGKYKVEVTTTKGCKIESNEVEIVETQAPNAIITINKENSFDKTITVSPSDSIVAVVWFKDGNEVASFANQRTIQPTESGNYKAKLTYLSGCEFETEEKAFTFDIATGIEEESTKIFTVYPNPNTGSFKVEFATTTNQKTNLVVVDALGRTIYSKEISRNEKTTTITLPKISAGVYVVQIVSQGKVYTKQLVIQ